MIHHRALLFAGDIRALRRRINLEFRSRGITATEIDQWQSTTFFPWLRESPEVEAIASELHALWGDHRTILAEPQILLRFPDWVENWPATPHIDALPDWAPQGARYKWIAMVSLTDCGRDDGPLLVWDTPDSAPLPVQTKAGDVVLLEGDRLHAGSLNKGPDVRMALYVRCIEPA